MLSSRCVLPLLALHLLLDEISAAVLPSRSRNRREASWLDQELLSQSDLSVGDAGDMISDVDGRPSPSDRLLDPREHLSLQRQQQSQFQYQRQVNEKRRKVAPLDSIGSFQMSGVRNRKDEPDVYCRGHSN